MANENPEVLQSREVALFRARQGPPHAALEKKMHSNIFSGVHVSLQRRRSVWLSKSRPIMAIATMRHPFQDDLCFSQLSEWNRAKRCSSLSIYSPIVMKNTKDMTQIYPPAPWNTISELAWLGTEVGVEQGLGTLTMTIATGTSRVGWNATGTGAMGMAPMGPMAPIGPTGYAMGVGAAKVTVGMAVMAEIAAKSSTCAIFEGSKQPEMAAGRKRLCEPGTLKTRTAEKSRWSLVQRIFGYF